MKPDIHKTFRLFIEARLRQARPTMQCCRMGLAVLPILLIAASPAARPVIELDAQAAQTIVAACAAHSAAKHQSEAIAVVDTGGHLIAALRMDGNGSGIMDFAVAKAEAVAAWGFSTAQMAQAAKETPGFASAPHVITVAGGVALWSADGKVRLGAVGVSGEAPQDDAECAQVGVAAAGLRSSHS